MMTNEGVVLIIVIKPPTILQGFSQSLYQL